MTETIPDYDTGAGLIETEPPTYRQPIALDQLGAMIEDQHRYEAASALCLLSLAYNAERIAAAVERLADRFERGLRVVTVLDQP